MKKSKIIVPALALLLLSTAASVSGTVAWFTANRTYTNTVSTFYVDEVDGALALDGINDLAGVTTTDSTTEFKVSTTRSVLTDGSFNPTSGILYTDNGSVTAEGSGVNRSSFIALGKGDNTSGNEISKWKAGTKSYTADNNPASASAETVDLFYAVSWEITLRYDYAADGNQAVNLFVDLSDTGTAFSATGTGEGDHVKTGLRIALVTSQDYKVLVPFYTSTTAGSASPALCHVNNESSVTLLSSISGKVDYSDAADGGFSLAKAADKVASPTNRGDYLGQFTNATPGTTNKIKVRVVVWLEGTDNNVLSGNIKDVFSGTLKFYSAIAA